jgi:hypothetical protein
MAEGGGGEAASIAAVERRERFFQISFTHQLARNVSAGDEVIDVLQERFHSRIKFVQVRDNGDASGARPFCGESGCSGIVTI